MSEVKERPILFNGEMVRAILEGRKTQTRRAVKPQPFKGASDAEAIEQIGGLLPGRTLASMVNDAWETGFIDIPCPYGQPGDRLWLRERWAARPEFNDVAPRDIPPGAKVYYTATPEMGMLNCTRHRPSIHMPRWVSRTLLEVVSVRVERLQEISEEDAKSEGVNISVEGLFTHREEFFSLWESINGTGSWDVNPWVWCVSFRKIDP